MYIRTSNLGTSTQMLNQVMSNQSSLVDSQLQLSTQKRINKPSDSAIDSGQIIQYNKQINKIKTYLNNITNVRAYTETIDYSLASSIESVQRANELSVRAANGTFTNDQLASMRTELDQIKESLVNFANTQYNGQYIFSGNNVGTAPYSLEDDGSVLYHGSDGTVDSERSIEIMDDTFVNLNQVGLDIFGYYQEEIPASGSDPAVPAEGSGIFQTLSQISNALDQDPPDQATVSGLLGSLQNGLVDITNARTDAGAYIAKRLDMSEGYLNDLNITLVEQKSTLEDIDIAQAITEYTSKTFAYQASLQTTAQSINFSLLNYL